MEFLTHQSELPIARERRLSMNLRVLPASCRQTNRRKALPARCRQHLGGAVSSAGGSWSQRRRQNERTLSRNDSSVRELDSHGLVRRLPYFATFALSEQLN